MIQYLKGDATLPQAKGPKLIVHICNTRGGWGKGFVLAVSNRWEDPEQYYRRWYASGDGFKLGAIQTVQVKPDTWVVNMIAQEGYKTGSKGPPIRYEALRECLEKVAAEAKRLKASIHAPRIGTGLGGAQWSSIEPILKDTLRDLSVTIYDF